MGFRIKANPTFKTLVRLHVPGVEADQQPRIQVEYKYYNPEQLLDFKKRNGDRPVIDALEEIMVGWEGPEDEQGKPLPFSRSALESLFAEFHTAGDDLMHGYYLEIYGVRRKN